MRGRIRTIRITMMIESGRDGGFGDCGAYILILLYPV